MARPKLSVVPPPEEGSGKGEGYQWETASNGKAVARQWLLPGRIVGNGLAVLEGDSSTGKSTLLAHLAACVTTGRAWLGRKKQTPRDVLWLTAEEDARSMVRPRLVTAGCDLERIHWPAADESGMVRQIYLPGGIHTLAAAIEQYQLALIVIEPLISYVDLAVGISHEAPARSVCDPLNQLCMRTGCCIIVTRGLRKDRTGPRSLHGSGAASIGQAARSVLLIERPDPDTEDRILRPVKCGGSRLAPPLKYTLVAEGEAPPVMKGMLEMNRDTDDTSAEAVDPGERDVRADARRLLRTLCATEYVPYERVMESARQSGVGERTLRKVKAELGVHSRQNTGGSICFHEWGPPLGGWPAQGHTPEKPCSVQPAQKSPKKTRKKT